MPIQKFISMRTAAASSSVFRSRVALLAAVRAVSRTSHSPRSLVVAVSAHAAAPCSGSGDRRQRLPRAARPARALEKKLEGARIPRGRTWKGSRARSLPRSGPACLRRVTSATWPASSWPTSSRPWRARRADEHHLHPQRRRPNGVRRTGREPPGAPPADRASPPCAAPTTGKDLPGRTRSSSTAGPCFAGLMVAGQAEGHSIETVESLMENGTALRAAGSHAGRRGGAVRVQQPCRRAAHRGPAPPVTANPTEEEVRTRSPGLFSRATGYEQFFLAVELARRRRKRPGLHACRWRRSSATTCASSARTRGAWTG